MKEHLEKVNDMLGKVPENIIEDAGYGNTIRKRNPKLSIEASLVVLKTRYAKGEITDAEFKKMKQNSYI